MSDTEVGDDLFGDEDGDGDDVGSGGEDGEEDEFVEVGAKGPLAANVARLRQKVWLAKVRDHDLERGREKAPRMGPVLITLARPRRAPLRAPLRARAFTLQVPAALWEQLNQDDQGGELVVSRSRRCCGRMSR